MKVDTLEGKEYTEHYRVKPVGTIGKAEWATYRKDEMGKVHSWVIKGKHYAGGVGLTVESARQVILNDLDNRVKSAEEWTQSLRDYRDNMAALEVIEG